MLPKDSLDALAASNAEIAKAMKDYIEQNDVNDADTLIVKVDEDGNVLVESVNETTTPDPCELPAMYNDSSRVSDSDSVYRDHLEPHGGFLL